MVIRSADTPPAPSPVSLGSGLPAEPVVARLTAAPGVQRVPSPKLTLFLNRGFLSPALCAALLERIDAVRRPADQHETPVAIAAVDVTEFVDLQPHARMAQRGAAGDVGRPVARDAGLGGAGDFERRVHGHGRSKEHCGEASRSLGQPP